MNSCLCFFVSLYFFQLTLTPAQQQLLLQQAQAQLFAAAVQHSAGQQSSTTGASISASAATPITLSQPIQITSVREPRFHSSESQFWNGLVLFDCGSTILSIWYCHLNKWLFSKGKIKGSQTLTKVWNNKKNKLQWGLFINYFYFLIHFLFLAWQYFDLPWECLKCQKWSLF